MHAIKQAIKRVPGTLWTVRFLRALVDPGYRSIRRLQIDGDPRLFQPHSFTMRNRYPSLLSFVQERIPDSASVNILSYGCSTGEEVFTLREYFPQAGITGIDINPYNINLCLKQLARSPDPGIRFVCAATPDGEADGRYDAIICISVLRNSDLVPTRLERCDPMLKFSQFDTTLASLARCLKPGGYLVLWNCHFRFCDSPVSRQFDVVLHSPLRPPRKNPLYGPDNRLMDVPFYDEAIFQKR